MDLNVPWIVRRIGNKNLRFGIHEWDWQGIVWVAFLVFLDSDGEARVLFDLFDDGAFQNDLWADLRKEKTAKEASDEPDKKRWLAQ